MNKMGRARVFSTSTALILSLVAPVASAEMTKDQCIDANGRGQDLRRQGKLLAASEQLRECANPACPAMVRNDCVKRLDELDQRQPSLVFDITNAAGVDLIDVRVSLDGQPLVDHLDGKPVKVDPGAHVFAFEAKGTPPVTEQLLVREGEAGRRVHFVIDVAGDQATKASAEHAVAPETRAPLPAHGAQTDAPAGSSSGLGAKKILGLTLAGAGVVGLGLGAVSGIIAASDWSSAKAACNGKPVSCTTSSTSPGFTDERSATSMATLSTVSFIAGGVLAATGIVVFLTAPGASPSGAAASTRPLELVPSPGPGASGIVMRGWF